MFRKTLQIFKLSNNAETQYEAILSKKRTSPTLKASRTCLKTVNIGDLKSALISIGQGVDLDTTHRARIPITLLDNFQNFVPSTGRIKQPLDPTLMRCKQL